MDTWIVLVGTDGGGVDPVGPFKSLRGENGAEDWLKAKGYVFELSHWRMGSTGTAKIRILIPPDNGR